MDIRETATFHATVETIFALIADGAQAVRWVSGVQKSEKLTAGPIGVGTMFRWVVQIAPLMRDENTQEITSFIPNQEIGFRGIKGIPITGRWLFSQENGQTRVTYEASADSDRNVLGKLVGSRMGREVMSSNIRNSLNKLRRIVEDPVS